MKNRITLFFLGILICFTCRSQITLSSSDMPTAGWTQIQAKDASHNSSIRYGNAGANQIYDFSYLSAGSYDTVSYLAPTSSQLSNFPQANLAITADNVNFLIMKDTGTRFDCEGLIGTISGLNTFVNFSPVEDVYHFPTQYNGTFSGSWGYYKAITGASVGESLADSIEVTYTDTYYDTIDGWGKVTTPLGSYKCLREARKDITHFNITVLTIFQTYTTYENYTETTLEYNYLAKETKGPVVSFGYDSAGDILYANYSKILPSPPVAYFTYIDSGAGRFAFTDSSQGYPTSYHWNFGDGDTSDLQNPEHTYGANGTYYVCETVSNAGGSSSPYCDSVHVTGLAATAPPVANNDSATVIQPNSDTIDVTANDYDPSGDSFCITSVYGSSFFSKLNCEDIAFNPDSSFSGNDTCWYVICDDDHPTLCDTAMVIVTVISCKPAVSFSNTCPCLYSAKVYAESSTADSLVWTIGWTGGSVSFINRDSLLICYECDSLGDVNAAVHEFSVCLTGFNSCGYDSFCSTIEIGVENINNVSLSGISIYPNPASNTLTIDMSDNTDAITGDYTAIEIYNAIGEKVKVLGHQNSVRKIDIPVSDLSSGMYLATITDAQSARRTLGKFTVER